MGCFVGWLQISRAAVVPVNKAPQPYSAPLIYWGTCKHCPYTRFTTSVHYDLSLVLWTCFSALSCWYTRANRVCFIWKVPTDLPWSRGPTSGVSSASNELCPFIWVQVYMTCIIVCQSHVVLCQTTHRRVGCLGHMYYSGKFSERLACMLTATINTTTAMTCCLNFHQHTCQFGPSSCCSASDMVYIYLVSHASLFTFQHVHCWCSMVHMYK